MGGTAAPGAADVSGWSWAQTPQDAKQTRCPKTRIHTMPKPFRIFKVSIFLESGVQRDPADGPDLEFDTRTGLNATLPTQDSHGRKGRAEELQRVLAFVELEHSCHRRGNSGALHERGHRS